MKRAVTGLLICGAALAVSTSAWAYDGRYAPNPVSWHVSGGYSAPSGQTADYIQGGPFVDLGFTYTPDRGPWGLRGDVSFSSHNATNKFLDYGTAVSGIQLDSGTGEFFSVTLGPSLSLPLNGGARLYGFAQVGAYYSQLQLSQTVFFSGTYCDPFFGFCQYALLPGDNVVYDDSRTRLGWNAGVGMEFPSHFASSWFIEAGYHRIEATHPLEYVPVTIGLRF